MTVRASQIPTGDSHLISTALNAAMEELARARASAHQSRSAWEVQQARVDKLTKAIESLIETLPADQRPRYLRQLHMDAAQETALSRGGPVFSNVVSLFQSARRRDWTTEDVQRALAERGLEPDGKTIANTLAYLAKSGKLRRIARGHYVIVEGAFGLAGIVTDEEIPGTEYGRTRMTEHDVG